MLQKSAEGNMRGSDLLLKYASEMDGSIFPPVSEKRKVFPSERWLGDDARSNFAVSRFENKSSVFYPEQTPLVCNDLIPTYFTAYAIANAFLDFHRKFRSNHGLHYLGLI